MRNLIIIAESKESFKSILSEILSEIDFNSKITAHQEQDQLLTIEEAAQLLNVSKTTISEWKKNGIIPFIRLGKRVYFERSKLLQAGRNHEKYQRNK